MSDEKGTMNPCYVVTIRGTVIQILYFIWVMNNYYCYHGNQMYCCRWNDQILDIIYHFNVEVAEVMFLFVIVPNVIFVHIGWIQYDSNLLASFVLCSLRLWRLSGSVTYIRGVST